MRPATQPMLWEDPPAIAPPAASPRTISSTTLAKKTKQPQQPIPRRQPKTDSQSALSVQQRLPGREPEPQWRVAAPISCGVETLDRLLPRAGLPVGSLTEWVSDQGGQAADWLALLAARQALQTAGGWLVVVDPQQTFFPPAAIALGIASEKIVLMHPENQSDHVWAIDQALRCQAVAAVYSPVGPWLDDRDARRLQLAAETGQTLGLLLRPAEVLRHPSFADVRWHIRTLATKPGGTAGDPFAGRAVQATLVRCRGGHGYRTTRFMITEQGVITEMVGNDEQTSNTTNRQHPQRHDTFTNMRPPARTAAEMAVHLAAQLARPAVVHRKRGTA